MAPNLRETIEISDSDTDNEQPIYSQITYPPSSQPSEIFEISDSDEGPPTVPATLSMAPNLRETIEISDSDTDNEQPIYSQITYPPSSQPSEIFEISDSDEGPSTVPATSSPNLDATNLTDDDDSFSISSPQKATGSHKRKGRAQFEYDCSTDSGLDSDLPNDLIKGLPSRTSSSTKRRHSATEHSNDPATVPSPLKKTRMDRPSISTTNKQGSSTAEKKKLDRELKEYERDRKKREKGKEKEQKDAAKAAKKAQRESERAQRQQTKLDKAAHKKANKVVLDKKVALKDMSLVLSNSWQSYPEFNRLLQEKLGEFGATIKYGPSLLPGYDTVRWERRIHREYTSRKWLPVDPPYLKFERLALIRLAINQLRTLVNENKLGHFVGHLRETHGLGPVDQVFIMVFGMGRLRKRNLQEWNKYEDALTSLQFREHTYHAYVEDDQEAVDRLYNYSGDLGIREEKLISRSYLPFCSNVKMEKGKDYQDIWTLMLGEIHRVTDSGAKGIVAEYPTMRTLRIAYDGQAQIAEKLLTECQVTYRTDGQKTASSRGHDKLGQALSRRVHTVLCGEDYLELVVKDK
ncbi:hypothetical protein GYMLUDRAFT_235500 [Collybiopsis luxurians FD-317 M1]|nr:hypothetical protein GYMLUDRAFT_235500 [Collybiopsis luxurians FD-317 M1]